MKWWSMRPGPERAAAKAASDPATETPLPEKQELTARQRLDAMLRIIGPCSWNNGLKPRLADGVYFRVVSKIISFDVHSPEDTASVLAGVTQYHKLRIAAKEKTK